jgi:hypothetical protein
MSERRWAGGSSQVPLWLSLWVVVLVVGMPIGLTFLLDRLPWMSASPLSGLFLGILVAVWIYLPVPPLVKARVFDGWKGFLVLGGWCSLFLVGFGAWLLFHLPGIFLISLVALLFLPLMVTAYQWKAEGRPIL